MKCPACRGTGLITVHKAGGEIEVDGQRMNAGLGEAKRPCPMGCKRPKKSRGSAGNQRVRERSAADLPEGVDDYGEPGNRLDAVKFYMGD